ncbi:hypothetical protein F5Y09DRAFT_343840 [Xylaria sp. FL1042]|nr:hypothetical protein F5Y09DRAFT_343840 [Xylaria sp. FL1042]
MSSRALLQRPPWLPRSLDNTYYVGANALTERAWEIIFDNLSKYPHLDFGFFGVTDEDTKHYIRQKLACLLPDCNYQYSHDQVSVWTSLMNSPLTVSNEDLQKIIAMEAWQSVPGFEYETTESDPRGFCLYQWTLSVYQFNHLVEYFKKEERTFHELIVWDDFIVDNKLNSEDKLFIRYIGSCTISDGPVKSMVKNLYDETEDARSGILADFLKALLNDLPSVARTCQCHYLQNITTSEEDEEGLHELVHSVLIEFFGASFVLNRHPDIDWSQWFTSRSVPFARLNLRFDHSGLQQGSQCTPAVAARVQDHFKSIMGYVAHSPIAAVNHGMYQFDGAKCAALLGQSMPRFYKGKRPIMAMAAQGMHINDYIHGRPFSSSHDPGNQLVGQLISQFKCLDLRAMHAEPFSYYCLAPWPRHESLEMATEFMWDYIKIARPMVTTMEFLDDVGKPFFRLMDDHFMINVPLLDQSRCRYGIESVDEGARKLMHTSFLKAMLIADKVMQALDDPDPVGRGDGMYTAYEEAVCELAHDAYEETLRKTEAGKALEKQFKEDLRMLKEAVEKEPLFIP